VVGRLIDLLIDGGTMLPLCRYAGKIARNQAERLVEAMNLPRGTFLIREREQDNGLRTCAAWIVDHASGLL